MSQANKVLKTSALLMGSQFLVRSLGLVSTLIIARLLVPEDFGILAISMLVIAFIEMLTMTGSAQYIHQKKDVSKSDVDTAWTLNLLLKCSIAVVIIYIAPFAAYYYKDPRLIWTITVLTSLMLMSALSNPGIILLEKDINYKKSMLLDITKKLISAVSTIMFAWVYGDYRALIFGHMVSCFVSLTLSYLLVNYRPRFSLSQFKEQWSFSRYALVQSAIGFFRAHIDTLIISKFYPPGMLGAYNTMKYVSMMPSSEVIVPALRPMIATFSKASENLSDLKHQFVLSVLLLATLILPVAVFLHVNSYIVVSILLGENWLQYSYVFEYLVLITITGSFSVITGQLLVACGHIKYSFRYNLISLVLLLAVLLVVVDFDFKDFLFSRVAFEIVISSCYFVLVIILLLKMNPIKIVTTILVNFLGLYFYANLLKGIVFSEHFILLDIFINGILFLVGTLFINLIVFKLLWWNTKEGQHLIFIVKSSVNSLLVNVKGKM